VQELPLATPSGAIPTAVPEAPSFSNSYVATLPASVVKPGLRFSVQINNGQAATVVTPRVNSATPITFVAVPVKIGGTTGEVISQAEPYLSSRLPVPSITYRVRAPYTSKKVSSLPNSDNGWDSAFDKILDELDDLHALEQASSRTYYYGFVPKRVFGLLGVGFRPGNAAIGFDKPNSAVAVRETMVHELGHNLSLPHAPCGGPARPDPNYPYPNAQLGSGSRFIWGYNDVTKAFTNPRDKDNHDLMSYCDGDTFSDYNYLKMYRHLNPSNNSQKALAFQEAADGHAMHDEPTEDQASEDEAKAPQELLLLSGRIDLNGKVSLSPVKSLMGQPRGTSRKGSHTVSISTDAGVVSYRFNLKHVDHRPDSSRFLIAIPHPGVMNALEIREGERALLKLQPSNNSARVAAAHVTASGAVAKTLVHTLERAGNAQFTWNHADHPYLTVVHVLNGKRTVLAQDLEGGVAKLSTQGLPSGGRFELSLSDGLNAVRESAAR
jgi:Peptidase M66